MCSECYLEVSALIERVWRTKESDFPLEEVIIVDLKRLFKRVELQSNVTRGKNYNYGIGIVKKLPDEIESPRVALLEGS